MQVNGDFSVTFLLMDHNFAVGPAFLITIAITFRGSRISVSAVWVCMHLLEIAKVNCTPNSLQHIDQQI